MKPKELVFFIGPCSMESEELVLEVASSINQLRAKLNLNIVFKSSFDKANRTSGTSYRSLGIERGVRLLGEVKSRFKLRTITDVHESIQVGPVSEVVDVLQVPAFLCRQTDLLTACGRTGLPVNIKKGQFMAPEDMEFAVKKVKEARQYDPSHNVPIYVTERGSSFGYNNLVVDFRSIPIIRSFAPCIFDVTHSTQRPGSMNGSSGGDRKWAPYLARAAAAVGVDGFFIETHPNPDSALSDGPLMIPLEELESLVRELLTLSQNR